MTNSETLAARIEAAGVDEQRVMLRMAASAIRPDSFGFGDDPDEWVWRFLAMLDAEAYLDAAMMLAPKRWNVGQWTIIGKPDCCLMWNENDGREIITSAATPALALAAAAIRAGGV